MQYEVQITLECIEDALDQALVELCLCFNSSQYVNILEAYIRLGRLDRAIDQLHTHFTTVVHDITMCVVTRFVHLAKSALKKQLQAGDCFTKDYATIESKNNDARPVSDGLGGNIFDYKQKCKELIKYDLQVNCSGKSMYLKSLMDLCKFCSEIMNNHHSIICFHESEFGNDKLAGILSMGTDDKTWLEIRRQFRQKLNFGRLSIWEDIQYKVSVLLKAKDVSLLKLNDYIFLLRCVSKLEVLGVEFMKSCVHSDDEWGSCDALEDTLAKRQSNFILRDIIKSKSVLYFKSFHKAKMEDMKTMLENDIWQKCPLQDDFSIYNLKEYSSIANKEEENLEARLYHFPCEREDWGKINTVRHSMIHSKYFFAKKNLQKWYGSRPESNDGKETSGMSLFDFLYVDMLLIDWSLLEDDVDICDQRNMIEVKGSRKESCSAMDEIPRVKEALLSSVSLNLVRLVGTYIEVMKVFRPLSYHIFVGLSQLFDYYVYAVYTFFGSTNLTASIFEPGEYLGNKSCLSDKLRHLLARLQNVINNNPCESESARTIVRRGSLPSSTEISRENSKEKISKEGSKDLGKENSKEKFDSIHANEKLEKDGRSKIVGDHDSTSCGTDLNSNTKFAKKKVYERILESRFPRPSLTANIDLGNQSTLYGLEHRVIAVESLLFVSYALCCARECIAELHPVDNSLTPEHQAVLKNKFQGFIRHFFTNTVDVVSELRLFMYKNISIKVVGFDKVYLEMQNAKWDLREIASEQSMYCDILVKKFELFGILVDGIENMPKSVYMTLWDLGIKNAMEILVHGYSKVKKCNNEGRSLMLLDLQHFVGKLENISPIMPIPNRERAENYIRAFYLNEHDFEEFAIKYKKIYPLTQLNSLVQTGLSANMAKKTKQKLSQRIEELYSIPK